MKRTKQRFDIDGDNTPDFVSGCRKFDGEDRSKGKTYLSGFESRSQ